MNDSRLDIKAFLDKDEQKDLLRFLTAGSVDDGSPHLSDACCSIVRSCTKISWMRWNATASVWAMPATTLIMHCYWMA